jgi:glycosyltransferase involved in cell wall biosynthesis
MACACPPFRPFLRVTRPRIALLRGHHVNVWELRPWERLGEDFDVSVLLTGSNLHEASGLDLEVIKVRTPRDLLPGNTRFTGATAYAIGERYFGLPAELEGTAIVHSAELGTWFSAQAARAKARLGFKLVLTVWETIAWREAYRWPRERAYRRAVLGATDLFLPTTERARDALRLEGVPSDRMMVCPPGVDLDGFAAARHAERGTALTLVLSAGRLVWEKGHQDVLRAVAAIRDGFYAPPRSDVRLLFVGSGPEEARLRRYAVELGLADAVEFRPTVAYDQMPGLYSRASCLVLASLPTRGWEEQFGMVLVEALAAGTPVVACRSGAIPEVVGDDAVLVGAGDWPALAQAIAAPGARDRADLDRLRRFSSDALAQRLRDAYARVLA